MSILSFFVTFLIPLNKSLQYSLFGSYFYPKEFAMLSIFKKKYFIVDFLEGLTDMHSHLLPGLDDGSPNVETSLKMIRAYRELGYKGVIATPHIMDGLYQNNSTKISNALNSFKAEIEDSEFRHFKIKAAAEYMMDQGFDHLLNNQDFLPLYDNHVLVEMSYYQRNMYVETQIFNLQQKNFQPVLAHPERYFYLTKPEDVLEFQKKGCDLQLNILSLSGHYGPAVYKQSIQLLINNHYDYIGTDAHRAEHLSKIKGITLPKKMIPSIQSLVARTKEKLEHI